MQEDSLTKNDNTADTRVGRHRLPMRPGKRTPYLVAGAVALVGFGLAGVSVVTTGHERAPAPAAVALDDRSRAEAATRADRSTRDSAAPVPPSATATTPDPIPSTGGPSASPSASREPASASAPAKPKPESAPEPKKTKPTAAWVSPMPGAGTTSCYGQRWGTLHAGVDLAEPAGTPIHAVATGIVVNAGWAFTGYGISVVIDHGNGYLTHYAHQSRTAVSVGAKVTAGQTIGYEGSTGDSTGPHLHFEVHQGQLWNQIDPAPFMRARGVDLSC